MKLTHLALASAMAVGSAGALAAGGPIDLSSGSAGFSSTPTAGVFSDVYTFSLAAAGFATSSITSAVAGTQDVDFTSIFITGPSGVFNFTRMMNDPFEVWTVSTPLLAAGAYTLTLNGTNSASIGSYGGNIGVSPIPEPGSLALLLGGLGVMGYVAKRRSAA